MEEFEMATSVGNSKDGRINFCISPLLVLSQIFFLKNGNGTDFKDNNCTELCRIV